MEDSINLKTAANCGTEIEQGVSFDLIEVRKEQKDIGTEEQEYFVNECTVNEDVDGLPLFPVVEIKVESDFTEMENANMFDESTSTVEGESVSGVLFQCEHCSSKFYTLKEHQIHKDNCSRSVTVSNPVKKKCFKCTKCSFTTSESYGFKKHMAIHSGGKPYVCTQCNYSSLELYSLRRHLRVHTGEKPYKCTQCSFATSDSSSLKIHLRVHTGEKPYKCAHCDYSTSESSKLRRHMRVHTGEKPYTCTICNYSSADSSSLKIHIRIHTGEKPYKCTVCNYSTSDSSTLKRHTRLHTGEKPFKCTMCDYSTSRTCSLTSHMQSPFWQKKYKTLLKVIFKLSRNNQLCEIQQNESCLIKINNFTDNYFLDSSVIKETLVLKATIPHKNYKKLA